MNESSVWVAALLAASWEFIVDVPGMSCTEDEFKLNDMSVVSRLVSSGMHASLSKYLYIKLK